MTLPVPRHPVLRPRDKAHAGLSPATEAMEVVVFRAVDIRGQEQRVLSP